MSSCCCCIPGGRSWEWASTQPSTQALVGTDTSIAVSPIDLPTSVLRLEADGRFTALGLPTQEALSAIEAGRTPTPDQWRDVQGTWSVESKSVTASTFFEVVLVSPTHSSLRLYVLNDSPPHELWIEWGDPDAPDGLSFLNRDE
jgi:hypothetical protein